VKFLLDINIIFRNQEARGANPNISASGPRRPVNLINGNYNLMPGACPWWNGIRSEAAE
jgi:hypothetical protein